MVALERLLRHKRAGNIAANMHGVEFIDLFDVIRGCVLKHESHIGRVKRKIRIQALADVAGGVLRSVAILCLRLPRSHFPMKSSATWFWRRCVQKPDNSATQVWSLQLTSDCSHMRLLRMCEYLTSSTTEFGTSNILCLP